MVARRSAAALLRQQQAGAASSSSPSQPPIQRDASARRSDTDWPSPSSYQGRAEHLRLMRRGSTSLHSIHTARIRPAHAPLQRTCTYQQCSYFHSSAPSQARAVDFYRTLGVSQSASQQDIKSQFYKLSKRYHPDVNQDDASAHSKFQQVSEAYATLGNEKSRRQYDSELRSGYVRHTGSGGSAYPASTYNSGYSYDPEANANRRARASYAWDYARRSGQGNRAARAAQRENGPSNAGGSRASYSGEAFGAGATAGAGAGGGAGFGYGTGGIYGGGRDTSDLFERLAERERRKEASFAQRNADRGGSAASASASGGGGGDSIGGGILRFAQISGLVFVIAFVGAKSGNKDGGAVIDKGAASTASAGRSKRS